MPLIILERDTFVLLSVVAVWNFVVIVDASPAACLSPSDFQKLCSPCRHYRRKSLRPVNTYSNFIQAKLLDLVTQYRQQRFIGNNNQDFLHLSNTTSANVDTTTAFNVLQTGYFYLLQMRTGEDAIRSGPELTQTMEREIRSLMLPFRKLICALKRKGNIDPKSVAVTLSVECLKMKNNIARFSTAVVRILLQILSFLENNSL